MDAYDRKYGIDSSQDSVLDFHRNRRMFCIKDGKSYISPPNVTYTHAVWFEKLGWMSPGDDSMMETTVRGFYANSELYFYVGYDFRLTEEAEREFLEHLPEIAGLLKLKDDTEVFGGMVKGVPGQVFKPRKEYGALKHLLK